MKISYPSILKLKSYQVLPDFDEHSTSKIFDIDVHQPLTYGKTVFFITYKIKRNQKDFFLRQGSEIKCEILDSRGKNIYTDFIPFKKVGGTGIGYIRIDDSLLERTDGWLTQDGQGEIILMGQLAGDSIPPEWRDTYNCRFTYPIKIRKELPNTSPLFFNTSGSLDLPRIDVYETLESDIDTQIYPDETYKRSFANIVFDNLHTIGGTTKFSEINYNPVSASTDDDTILDTIPISSSEMLLGRIANVGMTSLTDTASKFVNNTPTFPDAGVHSHSYGDTLLTYPQYGNEIQRFSGFTQNWNTFATSLNGVRRYPLGNSTVNHKYNEDIKIFRYAYEDEEYVLNFIGSGSFNIVIAESPHQTDLTSSFLPGRSTLDENSNYDDHLVHTYDTLTDYGTGNLNVIYSQSIIDWDPYTASKWISDNTEVDPSNIVSSSDGAIIKDTFTVSKGNFAAIHIMSSPEIGTSWTSSIDLVSIRPKENSGSNAPFYYHKVQMPPRRRNEVINFNSKFLNANMEIAQDLNFSDTNLIVSASSFFTGSPVIIEGDDGIFGGALRSRGYRGYRNASNSDGGAGFILYSGSIDTSGDFGSDGEYTGGVGFELHGGHNRDALKFSTETGELEITGSVLIEGVMTASSGEIGGWNIGESSLFHSSSTNQMILSGSKGTIDMFSGSNAFPSLQISSDINEDSGDALATPGLFVQDGVIFLKRTSGSMPQGSKSGVTPFEQIGTRIKPGFFHIHNSGSNSDEYQRLGNDGSVLGIHSVNQHTSGTAFGDDTNIIKIKSYQFQNTTDNAEHVLINAYGMVQSGTLYNIRVHNEGQRDAEDGHYLFYGEGENADYGNNFHFYIKNSTFKVATANDTFHEILPTSRSLTHVGGDYIYNYPANHSVLQQATSSANDGYGGGSNTKGNMPGIVAAAYSAPIGVSQTMGRDSSPFFTGLIRSATKLEPSIYVSASSNVGIRTFFPDKELTISGSVSASGDISSSGFFTPLGVTSSIHAVTASHALNGGGGGGTPGGSDTQVQFNDGGSFEGDAGFTYDKDTNSITAINHITASGNISASVDNYQRVIYNSAGAVFNNDGGNATVQIKGGTDDYLITTNVSGNDKVGIGQLPVAGKSKLQITGDVSTTSHITASGHISASGDLYGDYLIVDNDITASGNISASGNIYSTRIYEGSNNLDLKTAGGDVRLTSAGASSDLFINSNRKTIFEDASFNQLLVVGPTGAITASAGISASGNVIANSLNSDSINAIGSSITVGHPTRFAASVTASNNISASGFISSSGIRSNGQVDINSSFAQLRLSDDGFSDWLSIGQEGNVGYIKTSDADNNFKFRRGSDNTDLFSIYFGDEQVHVSGSGGLDVNTHITASGNISSSGDLFVDDISQVQHITASGNISASNYIYGSSFITKKGEQWFAHTDNDEATNQTGLLLDNNKVNLFSNGKSVIKGDFDGSNDKILINNTNGDIDFWVNSNDGEAYLFGDANNKRFGINTNPSAGDQLPEALTVEGNISSSGFITTNTNITSSENISASNHIFAQTGSFTGGIIADSHISSSGRIYGKQRETTFHQYNNDTSLSALFIPAPGGYIVESTAVNYYRQWVAPYDGELIKVIINFENDPGTVRLYLYLNGSATHRKSVSSTSTAAGINTFDMTSTDVGARSTFDEGDILAFTIQCYGAGPGDVNVTMVWEYNMFVDI